MLMSHRYGVVLTLVLSLGIASKSYGNELNQSLSLKQKCDPVGRMLSFSDLRFDPGDLLCQGDRLNTLKNQQAKVFCFSAGKILSLSSGPIAQKCKPQARAIEFESRSYSFCRRLKRNSVVGSPNIIQPFGKTIRLVKPLLSWQPVKGATGYRVQLIGSDWGWQKNTTQLQLPYPSDKPPLELGSVYKFIVFAYDGENLISVDEKVYVTLQEEREKQISDAVEKIKNLPFPEDEIAIDLAKLYKANGLLHLSINELELQVSKGSKSPGISRVLGDNYLETGFPEKALEYYNQAVNLAQTRRDQSEFKKAQQGVHLISECNNQTMPGS